MDVENLAISTIEDKLRKNFMEIRQILRKSGLLNKIWKHSKTTPKLQKFKIRKILRKFSKI